MACPSTGSTSSTRLGSGRRPRPRDPTAPRLRQCRAARCPRTPCSGSSIAPSRACARPPTAPSTIPCATPRCWSAACWTARASATGTPCGCCSARFPRRSATGATPSGRRGGELPPAACGRSRSHNHRRTSRTRAAKKPRLWPCACCAPAPAPTPLQSPSISTTAAAPRDAASANTEAAIWVDDDPWDEHDIPPRPWIAPGYALRGSVTLAIGPPSAMKSSLFIAWSCALALGRAHGDFRPVRAGSSILYNVEDVADEQRRRLSAALRQFGAVPADVRGRIIRAGPVGVGTLFVRDRQTGIVASTPAMEELRALIAARRPDILFADPLVELHVDDENDNGALRAIIAAFRAIAVEYDIAVVLAHHIRKGAATPGDPDA